MDFKNKISNKQRILIGGNQGADVIFNITKAVLSHIKKPADFIEVGKVEETTSAPIVFIKDADFIENSKPAFFDLDIHMLVLHGIDNKVPSGYDDFEQYVSQYEALADSLPKAGSFIYFEGNNVATLFGKKEREDVKNIEYKVINQKEALGKDDDFLGYAGGAKALLNRIGVSDEQFYSGLNTL